ncbi:hypothetical protein [Streptomyces sp. NBC_00576]|uniref:hypothetical protein n=1 Tax=Streptomyces sp. NBC_00576 TaxID=2903665 RepID=UPI002E7FBDBB|nr:hypothetical protein [Streptomyces sp. NBC_00576]WUB72907.1 hypothetical protein OG734_23930 [Streptomyces sp. NBC_00576]
MRLVVSGQTDVDAEELDALTGQLQRLLLELDVDDVRPGQVDGEVPEGAKSGHFVSLGVLVVTLAPAVLRPALRMVETWMQNRPVRSVRVELDGRSIDLGSASKEDRRRLLEAFVTHQQTRSDAHLTPEGSADSSGGSSSGEPSARE